MSDPVMVIGTPIRLEYTFTAGEAQTRFLRGLAERRIVGQRCPACRKVYVPPRGACPTCAVPTTDAVEVADRGIVTTFCIVNIPFAGQAIKPPFVAASVLLDGADIAIFHLLQQVDAADARMGMRVEAVWVPRDELKPSMESIRYFRPTGESDAAYESYKEHL